MAEKRKRYPRDPAYGKPPNWSKLYRDHFPDFTDPYSRHVAMIAQAMRDPRSPLRAALVEAGYEPDHYALSMEVTVSGLWKARKRREPR